MAHLSYEPGLVFCDGWQVRSEWELEFVQQDDSSSSEQAQAFQDSSRARVTSGVKRSHEGRTKDSLSEEKRTTKCARTGRKLKVERTASEQSGDAMSPRSKPKQDFIHVRARRGQATDSHSLAERVRREKISERMKFLQDLVPGCSKVTGKAVMLDEIINYVQSLQRQIEFLSMKLAAIDSSLDTTNLESLLNKEVIHERPLEIPGHREYQIMGLGTLCDAYLRRSMSSPAPAPLAYMDSFVDSLAQTISEVSDGDLHTIVQMGNAQSRQSFFNQDGHGFFPTSHLKVEY